MPCGQRYLNLRNQLNEFISPEVSLRKLLAKEPKIRSPTRLKKLNYNVYVKYANYRIKTVF